MSVVVGFYFPSNFDLFNLVVIVLEDNSVFEQCFITAQHRDVFSDYPIRNCLRFIVLGVIGCSLNAYGTQRGNQFISSDQ